MFFSFLKFKLASVLALYMVEGTGMFKDAQMGDSSGPMLIYLGAFGCSFLNYTRDSKYAIKDRGVYVRSGNIPGGTQVIKEQAGDQDSRQAIPESISANVSPNYQ